MGSSTGYRRRCSRAEWQALLAEQRDSGLTQNAFCRQRGLARSTFQHWKRKLAAEGSSELAPSATASPEQPAFTEIALADAEAGGDARPAEVALELGPGVRVIIRWGASC